MKNILWEFCSKRLASREDINFIQNQFDILLPSEFVDIVIKYNGGYPRNYKYFNFKNRGEVFNNLISFNMEDKENIIAYMEDISDRLIDYILPFAEDPFGNLICFDYRLYKDNPQIVFWDHELVYKSPEEGIIEICNNFNMFLELLTVE